jgi:EpsD family peptidyl-prolyl cis-trans isomerase
MAVVLAAGCSNGNAGKDVAAKVGGEKITTAQLDTELKAAGARDVNDPKLRQAALEEIIARKLLAQDARDENLTKAPEAIVLKGAAIETFEAELARRNLLAGVTEPTKADVDAFIREHPQMFERRTGYLIDQLFVPAQRTPELLEALKPTKTLEEVEGVLKARGVAYRRTMQSLDTLRSEPQLSAAIEKLPPGEPFILPDAGGFTVNRVRDSSVQPLTGDKAQAVAKELLLAQRRAKALRERLQQLKTDKVTYGEGFAPPAAKKPAA